MTGPAEGDDTARLVMDAAEAEDAAKGAGDQATPCAVGGGLAPDACAGTPPDRENATEDAAQEPAEETKEESKSSLTEASEQMETAEDQSAKSDPTSSNVGASVKRPLEKATDSSAANQGRGEDGPPSMTPTGRRSSYKPRPNTANADKKSEKKLPPLSSGTGPSGGSGGV
ncbi:brain acid soluble protein 1-like [Dermacentor albipictus]|uniref:brain acid soluble protein 1-like n=1 Tax=Dermacentor albipictus TaxID=60249 RepID=UPI0038FBF5CF